MKKYKRLTIANIVLQIILALILIFSLDNSSHASQCLWGWTASTSNNVVSYNMYRGTEQIKKDIIGTTYEMVCVSGRYYFTAVNDLGFESIRSKGYQLDRPKPPTNIEKK